MQSLQLQPLLQLQLLRRHRRPRSRCPHSLGLPVVRSSHHCQRLHFFRTHRRQFRQSPSPLYHRQYLQGEEERGPYFSSRHSQPVQQSRLLRLTLLLLTRLLLLRTLSQVVLAREPPRQLHPQSALTSSFRLSPRVHRPTTTTTMTTQTASLPYHDSRISSSPFWCFDAKGGERVRGELESGGG